MPRRARLDALGTLHRVIAGESEKRKIVDSDGDREDFLQRLRELAAVTKTAAYV